MSMIDYACAPRTRRRRLRLIALVVLLGGGAILIGGALFGSWFEYHECYVSTDTGVLKWVSGWCIPLIELRLSESFGIQRTPVADVVAAGTDATMDDGPWLYVHGRAIDWSGSGPGTRILGDVCSTSVASFLSTLKDSAMPDEYAYWKDVVLDENLVRVAPLLRAFRFDEINADDASAFGEWWRQNRAAMRDWVEN